MPGQESSFGGASLYTAAHTNLSDASGRYPNYRIYMSRQTTNAAYTAMTYGNSGATTVLAPATDTTWMYTAYIVARRTDADNESAAYWVQGAIDNNAGTMALVGAPTITAVEDTVGWDVQILGATGLVINVRGAVGSTVRWNGYVDIVQVSG